MSKHSLLLVDGDTRSLRVLEVSLRKAGFTVTPASSVQDALDKLELDSPDLIISETTFPDGDGFELRRRVRATPDWSEIPFVFLTASTAIENKIKGLELGVDDYLTKPIYIKEIITRINILLQKKQRARFEERRDGRTRFAGRVADMPVIDVIQTIEISRKSGVIQFVGERGRQAAIFFRDGKVIDAEVGSLQGEDAVYRLLTWSEGEFEVMFRTVRRRDVIATSSQGLLMEGMRRLDEWSRLLEQLPPLTHRFEVDTNELASRLGEVPDDNNHILRLLDGRRSLLEVIDASEFGDLECLQAISRLYFEELLVDLDHGAPAKRDTGKPMPLVEIEDAPTPMEDAASGPHVVGAEARDADSGRVPAVVQRFDSGRFDSGRVRGTDSGRVRSAGRSDSGRVSSGSGRSDSGRVSAAAARSDSGRVTGRVGSSQADSGQLQTGVSAPVARVPTSDLLAELHATSMVGAEPDEGAPEPGPFLGSYRPSSLRLIDEAVAAAQAIEPSLFEDEAPPNGSSAATVAPSDPPQRREDSGLRMIGSHGRDRAEASGELVPINLPLPAPEEPQREMVTILPRRITREMPAVVVPGVTDVASGPVAASPPETPAAIAREPSGAMKTPEARTTTGEIRRSVPYMTGDVRTTERTTGELQIGDRAGEPPLASRTPSGAFKVVEIERREPSGATRVGAAEARRHTPSIDPRTGAPIERTSRDTGQRDVGHRDAANEDFGGSAQRRDEPVRGVRASTERGHDEIRGPARAGGASGEGARTTGAHRTSDVRAMDETRASGELRSAEAGRTSGEMRSVEASSESRSAGGRTSGEIRNAEASGAGLTAGTSGENRIVEARTSGELRSVSEGRTPGRTSGELRSAEVSEGRTAGRTSGELRSAEVSEGRTAGRTSGESRIGDARTTGEQRIAGERTSQRTTGERTADRAAEDSRGSARTSGEIREGNRTSGEIRAGQRTSGEIRAAGDARTSGSVRTPRAVDRPNVPDDARGSTHASGQIRAADRTSGEIAAQVPRETALKGSGPGLRAGTGDITIRSEDGITIRAPSSDVQRPKTGELPTAAAVEQPAGRSGEDDGPRVLPPRLDSQRPLPVVRRPTLEGSGVRRKSGPGAGVIILFCLAGVCAAIAVYIRVRKSPHHEPAGLVYDAGLVDQDAATPEPVTPSAVEPTVTPIPPAAPATPTAPIATPPGTPPTDVTPPGTPPPATTSPGTPSPPGMPPGTGAALPTPTGTTTAPPATTATVPTAEMSPETKIQQAKLLMEKALGALDAGQADKAVELCDQSLKLRRTARTLLLRAQALQKLDRVDDALTSVSDANLVYLQSEGRDFPAGWDLKGKILWSAGRYDDARAAFQHFLELEPTGAAAAEARRRLEEPR